MRDLAPRGGAGALAEHFARGVPPIGMWEGVAIQSGGDGAPRLAGALGWLECELRDEVPAGTHTLFVSAVGGRRHGSDGHRRSSASAAASRRPSPK